VAETYLMTWNPTKWAWQTRDADAQAVRVGARASESRWSCGNRVHEIGPGDRFFLMQQGVGGGGIVGSGWVTTESFEAPKWDPTSSNPVANYVQICFDAILKSGVATLDLTGELEGWDNYRSTQQSGIRISSGHAEAVERSWREHLTRIQVRPSEVDLASVREQDLLEVDHETVAPRGFKEGSVRSILVNSYERNTSARDACLAHYGFSCQACGIEMRAIYGDIAAGLIEVHHLQPISQSAEEYIVDPVKDLIPLCPNCHRVIHKSGRPHDIDALRCAIYRSTGSAPS
jgi:5-methylcytosine-specific restriction enzyme A